MRIITALIFCSLFSSRMQGQSWQRDGNTDYLQHLFYNGFDGFMKRDSSTHLLFTSHQVEAYWTKKNMRKSETLISSIDESGAVSSVKKLDRYIGNSIKKKFGNNFYILDKKPVSIKKKQYYRLYIYNSSWEFQKQILIAGLSAERQDGFSDFAVDKDGHIYLVTQPYLTDHEPNDFNGSFLIKADTSGNFIKTKLFERSFLRDLQVSDETVSLKAYKQKLVRHYYQMDSIISYRLNTSLDYSSHSAQKAHEAGTDSRQTLELADGNKLSFIDSSYQLDATTSAYSTKIVMTDQAGNRKWTYEAPKHFIINHSNFVALRDGTFIVEVLKKWTTVRTYDTISIIRFDRNGKQKEIKTFLDGANPRMQRYFVSFIFEAKQNEVWMFYASSSPNLQEQIYFEKVLLPGAVNKRQ